MIKSIDAGGIKVNIAEATAENQFELYGMISARILHQCAATMTEDVNADLVKGILMSSEKGFTSNVAEIVLYKAFIANTETKVSLGDFQGKIDAYYSLIAEAVCLNLADFFISVKSQVSLMKENMQKAQAEKDARL